MTILTVNAGSSSLRLGVYDGDQRLADVRLDAIGGDGRLSLDDGGQISGRDVEIADHTAALNEGLATLAGLGHDRFDGAGHRLVHGGDRTAPARLDDAVLGELRGLVPLAPLHLPAALAMIDEVSARFPALPAVACFDTAFHARLPERAKRLPLPPVQGLRRYGFHGLSYEYLMSQIEVPPARIILAHLGAGSSLVALADTLPVDTTMGFTPAGGVVMGTRPGDVDPGALVHLARVEGLDAAGLEHAIYHRSGLVALGGTGDVRELIAKAASDSQAALALEIYAYSIRKAIGSYAAVLGGLDLLVFTGGVGEHAASVRWDACRGLSAFGLELDRERNTAGDELISNTASQCLVRVIPTNEEVVIARHAGKVLAAAAG